MSQCNRSLIKVVMESQESQQCPSLFLCFMQMMMMIMLLEGAVLVFLKQLKQINLTVTNMATEQRKKCI